MRFPLTSALPSVFAAAAATRLLPNNEGTAYLTKTPPRFEVLFHATFQCDAPGTIEGPLGTRLHAVINGGNVTDLSGNIVARILPTFDFGRISKSGMYFPELALGMRWEVDGKLAYMYLNGVASSDASTSYFNYVHLETDSESWSGLNSRFLVAGVGGTAEVPIYTLFGAL